MRWKWILALWAILVIGFIAGVCWAQAAVPPGEQQPGAPSGGQVWVPPADTGGGPGRPEVDRMTMGQKTVRLHKVSKGENLHVLAAYYYGNTRMWTKIYQDNRDVIRNPNRITEGMILKIDVSKDWKPRFPLETFLQLEERRATLPAQAGAQPVKEKTRVITDQAELVVPVITPVELQQAEDKADADATTEKEKGKGGEKAAGGGAAGGTGAKAGTETAPASGAKSGGGGGETPAPGAKSGGGEGGGGEKAGGGGESGGGEKAGGGEGGGSGGGGSGSGGGEKAGGGGE